VDIQQQQQQQYVQEAYGEMYAVQRTESPVPLQYAVDGNGNGNGVGYGDYGRESGQYAHVDASGYYTAVPQHHVTM